MTDQELEKTVNVAFDMLRARDTLKDALALFIDRAALAKELLDRASAERPEDVNGNVRQTSTFLFTELGWARRLRHELINHDEGR